MSTLLRRAGSESVRLRILTVAVPVAGALAVAVSALLQPALPGAGLALVAVGLAGAALAADLRPMRIGPKQKMSLATVPALACVFLVPAATAAAVIAVAALVSNLLLRRRPRTAAFNAGAVALAAAAAALLGGLNGDTGPLAVLKAAIAAGIFSLVTIALAAAASAAQRRLPYRAQLAAAAADSWPQSAAMGAVAIACSVLLLKAPWAAVLPLAVLPLIYRMNRALDAEVEARDRMERMLASQRRFLTDVSHNVGNPLATIRTNLSLLGRARLDADHRAAAGDAATEAARLSELFRRLRVLAETDDDVPMRHDRVDLAAMAADLVRAYTGPAGARRVRIEPLVEPGVTVTADEDLLRQAAGNLVENAIRYEPEGGEILIRVHSADRQARIEVIDHGPGIEPEMVPVIFERFQKGPEGGSGLGLAIARSVVERHGGQIVVDSRPGAETRFAIVLPGLRTA